MAASTVIDGKLFYKMKEPAFSFQSSWNKKTVDVTSMFCPISIHAWDIPNAYTHTECPYMYGMMCSQKALSYYTHLQMTTKAP